MEYKIERVKTYEVWWLFQVIVIGGWDNDFPPLSSHPNFSLDLTARTWILKKVIVEIGSDGDLSTLSHPPMTITWNYHQTS